MGLAIAPLLLYIQCRAVQGLLISGTIPYQENIRFYILGVIYIFLVTCV